MQLPSGDRHFRATHADRNTNLNHEGHEVLATKKHTDHKEFLFFFVF